MSGHRDYLRGYRAEKKRRGLCRDCKWPALPGQVHCEEHAAAHRDRVNEAARRERAAE